MSEAGSVRRQYDKITLTKMEHMFADICSIGLIVYRFSIPHCHCGETGSIPVGTAIVWPVSQEVKAIPFHGIIVGSSPIRASISRSRATVARSPHKSQAVGSSPTSVTISPNPW